MKHITILTIFLLSTFSMAWSQSGTLSGKVIDKVTGEDMIGAILRIEGTSLGAATEFDGTFSIKNIPVGTYQVKCSFVSFTTKLIEGVVIKSGQTTELNISMEELVVEGKEVEIVDFRRTDTEASVLMEMKEAKGVLSGMSAAQIARGQDRDASEVARRIPGVTVVDNRFVIVRGLSERYNAVSLNNAMAPSFESDVKSFAFDVIPSQLIDRFLIYKSPAPDIQGEFAGGAINIFTKTIPDQDMMVSADVASGIRAGTTFEDFNSNDAHSSTDALGFDNGTRQLPDNFPTNVRDVSDRDALQTLGRSLSNTWGYSTKAADPDKRVNVLFGKKLKIAEGVIAGTTTVISYSNTKVAFTSRRMDYNTYDEIAKKSDTIFSYNDRIYQHQARLGIMHNWGFRFGKGHSVDFRNLMNQTGLEENTFRTGINYEEGSYRREYAYRYNQRFIYSGQLNGKHEVFKNKGTVEWTAGFARTRRSDPDWRRLRYTLPFESETPNFSAYIPFSAQPFYLGRLWIDMKESKVMGAASYEHKLLQTGTDAKGQATWFTVKGGFYWEQKDRTFGIRNIGYAAASPFTYSNTAIAEAPVDQILQPANINTTNGLKLDEDTKPADSYRAANTLTAGYAMINLPYKKWNLTGGVRLEHNIQSLNSFTIQGRPLQVKQDSVMVLPSLNLSYNFTEKMLVRAAYGKTVNRPEFRELAPYYFYDFVFNSIYSGNDTLKFATIDNFDLRWEWYPTTTEFVSAGVFYKHFNNPIEMYFAPGVGGGGTRSFIPGNAPSAISYGVEVDVRKSMANVFTNKVLQRFSIVANASLIKSEIQLSDNNQDSQVKSTRPMMGQSPYVVNGGLYYQDDNRKLEASVLYNVVGPRIVIVGIPGIPEVYEMPRNLLDISVTKGFGKNFSVRLGVQDLLNQETILLQDANNDGKLSKKDDQRMQSYRRGAYYTVTLRYRFSK